MKTEAQSVLRNLNEEHSVFKLIWEIQLLDIEVPLISILRMLQLVVTDGYIRTFRFNDATCLDVEKRPTPEVRLG